MSNEHAQNVARGLPAGKWLEVFRGAGVEAERLESAKSDRGRATIIGNFLGRLLNREVGIEVDGRTGKATLRKEEVRSGQTRYYFDVVWDEEQPDSENQTPEEPAADGGPQPTRRATAARPTKTGPVPAPSRESPIDRHVGPGSTAAANDEPW